MNRSNLPTNVYRLKQKFFLDVTDEPWVYWINDNLRLLFVNLPKLVNIGQPRQGTATSDNNRFLRYWWEVGLSIIARGVLSRKQARNTPKKWFPYMKGGTFKKWYGNQEYVVNWQMDGREIDAFKRAVIRNRDYYYLEGLTWSDLSSKGFGVRYMPPGFVFDVKGSSGFPHSEIRLSMLAIMNSFWMGYSLGLLNPTVSFQVGDISRVPFNVPEGVQKRHLEGLTIQAVRLKIWESKTSEMTYEFCLPPDPVYGLARWQEHRVKLAVIEEKINEEVYKLYGIDEKDRSEIETELLGDINDEENSSELIENEEELETPITQDELAARWISYAVGIVNGRFLPGLPGQLGSAVFKQEDFAAGSLPVPDKNEFDELVGPSERFSYIDNKGGRHVFLQDVENRLRSLSDTDGVTVLDDSHPDDLPKKVSQALEHMLGEQAAAEVIATATGDSHGPLDALLKFFERDFFIKWHLKWYRKRPVYWLLQSPKKMYGLYVFHERMTRDTLYLIQGKRYLEGKINLTRQALAEKRTDVEKTVSARDRRSLSKEADDLEKLLLDLEEFAKRLKAITDRGYTPHIDDGVILNMAPLHEIIPSWSKEPEKYWKGLERGDYDWAQMAMDYWPERVRKACKTDKSLAIAHGHEEWYEG